MPRNEATDPFKSQPLAYRETPVNAKGIPKYTSSQASRQKIIERDRRYLKPRPSKAEISHKLEVEKAKERIVPRAKPFPSKILYSRIGDIIKVFIKPLSQNRAWLGKRFKSKDYKVYEPQVMGMLPEFKVPPGRLRLIYEFGFSRATCDIDNPAKICTDLLQKKYGFNDKNIYEMNLKKVITKKGEEYFSFKIESI